MGLHIIIQKFLDKCTIIIRTCKKNIYVKWLEEGNMWWSEPWEWVSTSLLEFKYMSVFVIILRVRMLLSGGTWACHLTPPAHQILPLHYKLRLWGQLRLLYIWLTCIRLGLIMLGLAKGFILLEALCIW